MNFFRKINKETLIALLFSGFIFFYFLFWMLRLYPTLINDEYSALDFIYRSVTAGKLEPPAHRFYKPYSLVLGFLAFVGGPFAWELASVLFASGLVFVFYLLVRQKLNFGFALLASLMLGFAPDLLDNTVQGITMTPAAFFIFLAGYYGAKISEEPERWKGYSLAGFGAGMARPEGWLLPIPLLLWLFPKDRRQIFRWLLAPGLTGLSGIIWFGKDWFLAHNLFHSFEVARYDRIIGTGAPSGMWQSLKWFHIFLGVIKFGVFSIPFELICLLGLILYVRNHFKKALWDPLLVFPTLFFLFTLFLIRGGLYPQMRHFFLISAFLIFYASYFYQQVWDYLKAHRLKWLSVLLLTMMIAGYFFFAGYRLKTGELKSLKRTSQIQKDTIQLAEYFRPILQERPYRILMPDREDDQFLWLLRDLPAPEIIHFREVHYYAFYQGRDFLSFEPDWIIWLPGVYQHKGVDEMFEWLSYQDQTEWRGHLISLEKTFGEYRVFRVTRLEENNQ